MNGGNIGLESNTEYGLLGARLVHSYSPRIHSMLADYDYKLVEVDEDGLDALLRARKFRGMNVTIPYKKAVIKYCDVITDKAASAGSINTLAVGVDGTLTGYNTDYDGFMYSVISSGMKVADKKILVLGSGGASVMAQAALRELGAGEIIMISRTGKNNYSNLLLHRNADIIINTTPVGMYPENGNSLIDLEHFTEINGVFDLIYNPSKTALLLQAERLGIPYQNGLKMLVAQAKLSAELFTGKEISNDEIERITGVMNSEMQNIVLIGMPGCGKTTIGKILANKTGRELVDTDEYIETKTGRKVPDIITEMGEEEFRKIESECIEEICKRSSLVIATGGGAVIKSQNRDAIRQNAKVIFLNRDLRCLDLSGRPLSKNTDNLRRMFEERHMLYKQTADMEIDCNKPIDDIIGTALRTL